MTRFLLIGGFLGAGKTTTILRLAGAYAAQGRRVAMISNDQASGLVDTATFRRHGFATEEVPRGCFCCRFDELIAAAGRLVDGHQPDVILAEPVGSCTDIMSTVIKPLRRLYAARFVVAPYVALLDPQRARQALAGRGGFSEKVTYIYKMQQHEAAVVAINKADTLTSDERHEIEALVARSFPAAQRMVISARTGAGFDGLLARLESGGAAPDAPPMDVDYDVYAEGEARLAWLNGSCRVSAATPLDLPQLLVELGEALRRELAGAGMEPAHIKILAQSGDRALICNVVGGNQPAELSESGEFAAPTLDLLLNVRAEGPPADLRSIVEACLRRMAADCSASLSLVALDSFAPGRPQPKYRFA